MEKDNPIPTESVEDCIENELLKFIDETRQDEWVERKSDFVQERTDQIRCYQ